VRPGDRVGLALPKTTAALVALFGTMKARAAYVPVDWSGPVERGRTILRDCQVRAVFVDSRRAELACLAKTRIVLGAEGGNGGSSWAWETVLDHEPIEADQAARRRDDLAYILYTSGSTGIPKGVMLTHENATSYVDWCSDVFQPEADDRFSSHAPFHFDLSILDIYVPIKHGASAHLIPDELGKSPRDLAAFIAERRLTIWYSTPAILGLLAEFGRLGQYDYSALRLVLFAGEVFPVKQLRRLQGQWPTPEYYNLYGPTETNVCTFARIPRPIPAERTEPYPIGWPCSHCLTLVLDPEKQPVATGEEGLLYIAGPSVFAGYWQRPTETGAAFIEHDGQRWYNTGDVVVENSDIGFLYVGRRDRMIKRRGYRIELNEVESGLYLHPRVSGAAVVAVPHPEAGMRIIAYVVANPDSQLSVVEMKTFCNQRLPGYMNPDFFIFVDGLPRTSTAKTDYQELIRRFEVETATSGARVASAS
jgi:amino acid adenylation domain-containing protein